MTPLAPRTYTSTGQIKGQPLAFLRGHTARRPRDLSERFWEKVDTSPGLGPAGECYLWRASVNHYGYGKIGVHRDGQGWERAHRVAWFLATGEWPTLNVLHRCDTPACVRYDHLFLGTHADNVSDRVAKGRTAWGTSLPQAKLTIPEVEAIYALRGVEQQKHLAKLYGVTPSTIGAIWRRETWAAVTASLAA